VTCQSLLLLFTYLLTTAQSEAVFNWLEIPLLCWFLSCTPLQNLKSGTSLQMGPECLWSLGSRCRASANGVILSTAAFEKSVVSWAPDADVSLCMTCGRHFTLTRRRHHCRLCGRILCHKCSHFLPFEFASMSSQLNINSVLKFAVTNYM